jgi:hypothetical protein
MRPFYTHWLRLLYPGTPISLAVVNSLKIQLFFWLCVKEKSSLGRCFGRGAGKGPAAVPFAMMLLKIFTTSSSTAPLLPIFGIFLSQHYSLTTDWKGSSFTDCFISWISDSSAPHSLAAHVCWQTWKERNLVLFEGRPPSLQAVLHRILSSFHLQQKSTKNIQIKARDYLIAEGSTISLL